MNQTMNAHKSLTKTEAREQLKLQLTQYVQQQPESGQAFHKWMQRLELVSMILIAVTFVLAMYLSITWKSVNPLVIPIAWFAFVASPSLLLVLAGLHSIVLRAFPPIVLPGKVQKFVTGSEAIWFGLGTILVALAVAVFWGVFAYATWTQNWAILQPLIGFLGVVLGIGIAASIVVGMAYTIIQKITKTR